VMCPAEQCARRSDIERFVHAAPYGLTAETAQTLNPSALHGYADFPAYATAFLKSYAHLIVIHPSAAFLAHLVPALGAAVQKLEAGSTAEDWVLTLRAEPGLRGYLWHRDLHFGNIMVDPATGTFKSILDWEFAGVGVRLSLSARYGLF
jgi:Ser/Thr protein kinase RdoA (MazF antagonist)